MPAAGSIAKPAGRLSPYEQLALVSRAYVIENLDAFLQPGGV